MIARIAGDAMITRICDQGSLRRDGNSLVQVARDRCVAAIAAILASKRNRKTMNFSDPGLPFNSNAFDICFLLFENLILLPEVKTAIVAINGNQMTQNCWSQICVILA